MSSRCDVQAWPYSSKHDKQFDNGKPILIKLDGWEFEAKILESLQFTFWWDNFNDHFIHMIVLWLVHLR